MLVVELDALETSGAVECILNILEAIADIRLTTGAGLVYVKLRSWVRAP